MALTGWNPDGILLGKDDTASDSGADSGSESDTGLPPAATAPVYVHDYATLYTWDPETLATTTIGAFTDATTGAPLGSVLDIAIDGDGQLFAAVGYTIYRVDAATGASVYELSVTESGTGMTVLPDGRLLVAGSALTAWDLETGASEAIRPAGAYTTSGDVVALPDGSVHWSVVGAVSDLWVVVDPETGAAEERGAVGASGLWGVAYSADVLYAFASDGGVYQVDPGTGAGTLTTTTSISLCGATTNPVTW